jgi:hypothetical protein
VTLELVFLTRKKIDMQNCPIRQDRFRYSKSAIIPQKMHRKTRKKHLSIFGLLSIFFLQVIMINFERWCNIVYGINCILESHSSFIWS